MLTTLGILQGQNHGNQGGENIGRKHRSEEKYNAEGVANLFLLIKQP